MTSCVFCKIANSEIPSKIVYENDEVIAFEDLDPKAPVHVVIIPKIHIERLSDAKKSDEPILGRLCHVAAKVAREMHIEKSGYRLVVNCNKDAGQEVMHLHLHLLGGRKFSWPPG